MKFIITTQLALAIYLLSLSHQTARAEESLFQGGAETWYFSETSIIQLEDARNSGRIKFPGDIRKGLKDLGLVELNIKPRHRIATSRIPGDWFDRHCRMIEAQARCEGLEVVSLMCEINNYES